jgi:hypothetical protein
LHYILTWLAGLSHFADSVYHLYADHTGPVTEAALFKVPQVKLVRLALYYESGALVDVHDIRHTNLNTITPPPPLLQNNGDTILDLEISISYSFTILNPTPCCRTLPAAGM